MGEFFFILFVIFPILMLLSVQAEKKLKETEAEKAVRLAEERQRHTEESLDKEIEQDIYKKGEHFPNEVQVERPAPKSVNNDTVSVDDESKKNYNLFDNVLNGSILSYKYEEYIYLLDNAINKIKGNGGEELSFVQEPTNEYDNKAIAVYLNKTKIGYVYRGKIQDMLNDWISRKDIYYGYINKIFVTENKATYKIGFYKPFKQFTNKTFSLIKMTKKIDEDIRREDNLYCVSDGDEVTIEYDEYIDNYVVYNKYYDEIGELSSSAATFIDDNSHSEILGFVKESTFTESGAPKVRIVICLK